MKLSLRDGLPFVTASVEYRGQILHLDSVLIDTGSSGTVFAIDKMLAVGLKVEPEDEIQGIRGVSGTEFVFHKIVDAVQAGTLEIRNFEIQVGAMDYGMRMDGILGMDFLQASEAVVDQIASGALTASIISTSVSSGRVMTGASGEAERAAAQTQDR